MRAGDQEAEKNSGQCPAVSDGSIHVYAHRRSERAACTTHGGSEEVGSASYSTLCVLLGWLWLSKCFPQLCSGGDFARRMVLSRGEGAWGKALACCVFKGASTATSPVSICLPSSRTRFYQMLICPLLIAPSPRAVPSMGTPLAPSHTSWGWCPGC